MLSPFQTLPEHIIRTITGYFHHHPTRQAQNLQTYTKQNHQLSTTHQLLSSSQRWRTAALLHILGTITIIIPVIPGQQLALGYDNWAYPQQEFPLWLAQRFVRYIRVNADYAGICQGAAASALEKQLVDIPEGFFKTRRVEVTVTGKPPDLNTVSGVSLQEALLNADKFIQVVHQLSPNSIAAGFNIHIHQPNTHLNKNIEADWVFGLMASKLYRRGARQIGYSSSSVFSSSAAYGYDLGINFISKNNLSSIHFQRDINADLFYRLLRSNNQSLREIKIKGFITDDLAKLLSNTEMDTAMDMDMGDGTYVNYPSVKSVILQFNDSDYLSSQIHPYLQHPGPFPHVQRLLLAGGIHSLPSDILLRNTHRTLQHLTMCLDDETIQALEESQTFAHHHKMFSSLISAKFVCPSPTPIDDCNKVQRLTRFILSVAGGAAGAGIVGAKSVRQLTVVDLDNINVTRSLLSVFPSSPLCSSSGEYRPLLLGLQVLKLPKSELTVCQIIDVAGKIPSLRIIKCQLSNKIDILDSSEQDNKQLSMQQHVDKKYTWLGGTSFSELHIWKIAFNPYTPCWRVAEAILDLTQVFPGLKVSTSDATKADRYWEQVEKLREARKQY